VHKGAQSLVKDLNKFYKKEKALFEKQFSPEGFEWIDHGDHQNSVLSYIRKGENEKDNVIIVLNLTPVPRQNYRIGLPKSGSLKQVFNSDDKKYYGTGEYKNTKLKSEEKEWNNRQHSLELTLPPLSMIAFKYK
jgi:1,4-alpha-glucan branching enzyme